MATLLAILTVCAGLSILAKVWVKVAWAYYSNQYPSNKNITGRRAAIKILDNSLAGSCCAVSQEEDSNCFYHKDDTIALTQEVYNGSSILAICVAAHEAGHALQFSQKDTPLIKLKLFFECHKFYGHRICDYRDIIPAS